MSKKYQPIGIGMTPSETELGSFVRSCRLKLGLRQNQLAERVGLTQFSISNLEIGRKKHLADYQLEKFAEVLECAPDELRNRIFKKLFKYSKPPQTELGKLIRLRREELGLSIDDLAKNVGMDYQNAWNLEGIKHSGIYSKTAESLARVLNLNISVFEKFIKEEKSTSSKLGGLIRMRRKELHMSLEQIAKKLNVKRQFVSQIEFGKSSLSESDNVIIRLAEILQYDVNKLMAARSKRKLKRTTARTPLGAFLVDRRLDYHLTQKEVSERVGVSTYCIFRFEKGITIPSRPVLNKISEVFACAIPDNLVP